MRFLSPGTATTGGQTPSVPRRTRTLALAVLTLRRLWRGRSKQLSFFAGEATDAEEMGTVAGALKSGKRAAEQLLALRH